jgi:small-conductance mechanosensitive channel
VGGLQGDVVEINARSTKIVTNENFTIIVPNSEFISSRVINWSHGVPKIRFSIPVGVAHGTDPQLVKRTLLEVAAESPEVLKDPPAAVYFRAFGESALGVADHTPGYVASVSHTQTNGNPLTAGQTAAHELGHVLGLDHYQDGTPTQLQNLMFANYLGNLTDKA